MNPTFDPIFGQFHEKSAYSGYEIPPTAKSGFGVDTEKILLLPTTNFKLCAFENTSEVLIYQQFALPCLFHDYFHFL